MKHIVPTGRPLDGLGAVSFFDGLVFFAPVALLLRVPGCLLEGFQNDLVDELGEGERRAELLSAFNMSGSLFEVVFLLGSAAVAAAGPALCFGAVGALLALAGPAALRALGRDA